MMRNVRGVKKRRKRRERWYFLRRKEAWEEGGEGRVERRGGWGEGG